MEMDVRFLWFIWPKFFELSFWSQNENKIGKDREERDAIAHQRGSNNVIAKERPKEQLKQSVGGIA